MKFLFICTHNRCRSILAEAVFNKVGGHCLEAKSAGSQPVGVVHPLTLEALHAHGIPHAGLQSQSWDDFSQWEADVVITVCDSAAGESCPLWFGDSLRLHWGLRDPSSIKGSEDEVTRAFATCIAQLTHIAQRAVSLVEQGLPRDQLLAELTKLEVNDGHL